MSTTGMKASINQDTLVKCVSLQLKRPLIKGGLEWNVQALSGEVNFTTQGIYRVFGSALKKIKWSLIIKVIQEVEDKRNPQHHNYWKREALIHQTGILNRYSNVIKSPTCYEVDEKSDGTIWIWMEEVNGVHKQFSKEDFAVIAKSIGYFNGTYVNGPAHDEEWICRTWMASWIKSSQKYAMQVDGFVDSNRLSEQVNDRLRAYLSLTSNMEKQLNILKALPRVLAHQDLSKGNIFVNQKQVTLIDWQFMSLSGVGEDLGKLFGVMLSQEAIPIQEAEEYQELLLRSYVDVLVETGIQLNEAFIRYGFFTSFALRCVWEVPKLVELHIKQQNNCSEYERLLNLTSYQLKVYREIMQFPLVI